MSHETADSQHAEIDARLGMVIARSSQILNDADRELVRKHIARAVELRGALRAVALENHDEPEHGFDPAAMHLRQATNQDQRR